MVDPIANTVDIWDDCLRDVGNKCVRFPGIHDIDWLSAENTDITPWHYSKHKSYLSGCAVVEVNGWRAYWDVRKHYIPFPTHLRYCNSLKFADFLLSDAHDNKEAY